ncbi:hypothetical protein FH972_023421 [Carpinus fangiana]|uniref:Uncharacterized protein n=1 Tax=Carpinus fangiana TaxID=176857 RepID=A0A5N6KV56_9ROSI|nr:hypothetical protein FH972_023421 [Carpinus fangiana]
MAPHRNSTSRNYSMARVSSDVFLCASPAGVTAMKEKRIADCALEEPLPSRPLPTPPPSSPGAARLRPDKQGLRFVGGPALASCGAAMQNT